MLGPGRHQEEGRTLGPCQAVWEGSLFSPQRGDAEPRSRELARGLMGWGCWFTCPQPVSGGLCTCSQWGWRESREAHAACTGYGSEQPQGTGGLSFDHCQLLSTNANLFCPEVALQCLWRASESILALLLRPIRRPARGEKPKHVDKIPGLRKRKGSQTLTLAYFPAFRKITAPNPSKSSLPPHESLGRLLLVSNLEK